MSEVKQKTNKNEIKVILIVLGVMLGVGIINFLLVIGFLLLGPLSAKEEVYTDIKEYNNYIGLNADKTYKDKWNMDEEIFPSTIKKSYDVKDFKFVYYDPWDANYLAYLEIDYNEEDYQNEVNRLKKITSKNYKGYYGVTGFTNYNLLAINADKYYGFIYALDCGNNKIVYVEMIFCNYAMDIDYEKYIPSEYLPDGYDATDDNEFKKIKDKEAGVQNIF
jgi:hypothetical protein